MNNATAITTSSANQRSNTPCIRVWNLPFRDNCGTDILGGQMRRNDVIMKPIVFDVILQEYVVFCPP